MPPTMDEMLKGTNKGLSKSYAQSNFSSMCSTLKDNNQQMFAVDSS